MEFWGYPRTDGRVGIRNHVLVLPSCMETHEICRMVRGTVPLNLSPDAIGRTQRDREAIARHIVGLGQNPNVAAVLIAGFPDGGGGGYPELQLEVFAEQIAQTGKRVEVVSLDEAGGSFECIHRGIRVARDMVREASALRREPFGLGSLSLGVKCGGSDTTSGIAGNPVLGHVYDRVVEAGGTCMFGEITEVIGAEHVLALGRQILDAVHEAKRAH